MSGRGEQLNPNSLTVEQVAKVLSAAARKRISVEQIHADIKQGAPTNSDGTVNLVHYGAWIAKEIAEDAR